LTTTTGPSEIDNKVTAENIAEETNNNITERDIILTQVGYDQKKIDERRR